MSRTMQIGNVHVIFGESTLFKSPFEVQDGVRAAETKSA